MDKNRFKLALQCIVICSLTVLFIISFSYTFIVYFSSEKELEDEIHIDEICRPYSNGDQYENNSNLSFFGTLLQNISVDGIYTDHPMCLDALLPVFCSILYSDNTDMSGGWNGYSSSLNECNSVLPNEQILYLASLPTVYFEDITCADGFYLLNYTCRPHCTQFESIYHSTATIEIGFQYFVAISNAIITSLFLIVVCFNRKTMLKFPSVLFVYMVVLLSVLPLTILINLLSGRALLCSDDDLMKSFRRPSAYCVISGILLIIYPSTSFLWIIFVAVIFWKLVFPSNSLRYRYLNKWIHALTPLTITIFVILYILIITTNGDFFPIQSDFPSLCCVSRNGVFNFSYIVLPSIFLCSLGMFLLLIILFRLQMRYGCSLWRKDTVINTAEKKILLLLFTVGCVATINGVYYTISLHTQSKLQAVLKNYILCELSGYSMNSGNDVTTCSKDELETYNYVGLSITSGVFTFIFLPLLLLLVMIEWRRFIQWMKVSFRMKETTAVMK